MKARLHDGWLIAGCGETGVTPVFLAVGEPDDWQPAFLDWVDGERVAKIRPHGPIGAGTGSRPVWLRVGDEISRVGRLTI